MTSRYPEEVIQAAEAVLASAQRLTQMAQAVAEQAERVARMSAGREGTDGQEDTGSV